MVDERSTRDIYDDFQYEIVEFESLVDWTVEHLLKLVELFVVVPVALAAALLGLLAMVAWRLVQIVLGSDRVPDPPGALDAIVRWPYRAITHILTGRGGFQWTPRV